jgi:hypothetical protein
MGKLIIGIYTNLYHRIAGASYGSDHWNQNNVIAPNRDDYSQHVEFNHVHHYGLDILSDFGGIYKGFLGCVIHFCLSALFCQQVLKPKDRSSRDAAENR